MVEMIVRRRIGDLGGPPLQAVLANHPRPALTGLDIFRNQQNAISIYLWPNVQHHFVATESRRVIDEPGTRIWRQAGIRHSADDFPPDIIAMKLRSLLPSLRRG